jgi:hypothetical protein
MACIHGLCSGAGAVITGAAASTASLGIVTGSSGAAGAAYYADKMKKRTADVSEFGFVQLLEWDELQKAKQGQHDCPSRSEQPASSEIDQLQTSKQSSSPPPGRSPQQMESGAPLTARRHWLWRAKSSGKATESSKILTNEAGVQFVNNCMCKAVPYRAGTLI